MREIIRYLLRHRIRSALTILAVAVGIFAVTTVGSIAEYMERFVIQPAIENASAKVDVYPADWWKPLTEATLRRLRRVEGAAGVTATLADRLDEEDETIFRPRVFSGTRSDVPGLEYEPPLGSRLRAGRLPAPGNHTETVVSWDVAQDYGLEVDDVLAIRERPFRVVGIWEYVEWEDNPTAFISYDAAEQLSGDRYSGVGRVHVIPQPGADPQALAERIREDVEDVEVTSPQEAIAEVREGVLLFSLIIGASGVLALIIGTFTIVNTMLVSVHERRREIGLKKALGAADSHVLAEFVAEAAFIGGLGGLLGVLAGWIVGLVANRVLLDRLAIRLFLLTPRLAVGAVVFTVLMGSVAGLYPAWRAARLDPVVALRGGGGATVARRGLRRVIGLIRRNARSILTVVGIAVGIFALVVLGSLSEYLNHYLDDAVEGSRHKVYVRPEDGDVPFGRTTARIVRGVPGVRDVVLTRWGGYIEEDGEDGEAVGEHSFYGIESPTGEFGWEMAMDVRVTQGRNLAPGSLREVVIGPGLAEKRGLDLGSTLVIGEREFTVVGIRERVPRDMGEMNYTAHITLDALARVLGEPDPFNRITALIAPGEDPLEVAQAIEVALPGVETMTTAEQAEEIRRVLAILFGIMGGLLSIAVFVGSVSVANTMIIAVHERTREIGLKKAVGAEDPDVLAEILIDAGKLGGLGGVLGILLAWPVTLAINLYAQQTGGFTIVELTPRLVAGAGIFSTVLGMASGLLPAWRAARLDPVVALRTE